jgi:hypothetical protein
MNTTINCTKAVAPIKMEKTMSVATTILEQLGGGKFRVMTGAKHFVEDGDKLIFMLPSHFAKNGINKVVVRLMPSDTYEMEFWKIRGTQFKLISQVKDIYNDQLQEIFTKHTGLDTHL